MRCYVGIWLVAGCLGAPAREPSAPIPVRRVEDKQIILGGRIDLEGSGWNSTCSTTHWEWEAGKDEHDAPGIGQLHRAKSYYTCGSTSFHVQTKCSLACEIDAEDGAAFSGSASVRFVALEVGKLDITLELINDETSEQKRVEQRVEVVAPTGFRLQCMTPTKSWGACDGGISATDPQLRVFALIGNKIEQSTLLRVNGKPGTFTRGVSLADYVNGPVGRGPVEVTVSLGPKTETFSLVVQDGPNPGPQ